MTNYISDQQGIALNHAGTMTSDKEHLHRILHKIGVSEKMHGCDVYRDGVDEPLQKPARVIARTNREYGWATIPLTGNEAEDDEAYLEGGDFSISHWGFSYAARPLIGSRRRMGEPIPHVRLNRAGLELVLLTHNIMHQSCQNVGGNMTDPVLRHWAMVQAQAKIETDRRAALYMLAAPIFQGGTEQKLRQLEWLLDGHEPGLVVCRHCYYCIDEADPYLLVDAECESHRHSREHDSLPHYSVHEACYAAQAAVKPIEHEHHEYN